MKPPYQTFISVCIVLLTSACAAPLSQQLTGHRFQVAKSAAGDRVAQIEFSADQKYESPTGVPFRGDPLICKSDGIFRVNDENSASNRIAVRAEEEIAVTSVIAWVNTGFRKVCGPFVRFTPENGARYIVVNERIGGKGVSALWTGIAFQTCLVSVYKENATGFERVDTSSSTGDLCRITPQ